MLNLRNTLMILQDTVVFEKNFQLKSFIFRSIIFHLKRNITPDTVRNVILYLAIMGNEYLKITK